METVKQLSRTLYAHSLVRYFLIGGASFALDFFLLVFLHTVVHLPVLVAAAISYWTSIIFNFLANRFWTFEATETHIAQHAVGYGLLLGVNFLFTLVFIGVTTHFGLFYAIAKVLAVAIQMSWTYIAYKKLIFR